LVLELEMVVFEHFWWKHSQKPLGNNLLEYTLLKFQNMKPYQLQNVTCISNRSIFGSSQMIRFHLSNAQHWWKKIAFNWFHKMVLKCQKIARKVAKRASKVEPPTKMLLTSQSLEPAVCQQLSCGYRCFMSVTR